MIESFAIPLVLQIAAALACGPLDRLRGHHAHLFGLRIADKIVYGLALAAVAAPTDPIAFALVALAMIAGMSPGWGEPMGAILEGRDMRPGHLEWWQKGRAEKDPYVALALRGVIWGAPVIPIAIWFKDWSLLAFVPAFAVATPAAMLAARLPFGRDKWGNVEYARGWIAAVILLAASQF